jgi:hypothetical protein
MLSGRQNFLFRPRVQAAWLEHCRLGNLDPADRLGKDRWYRKELVEHFGIYTTKEIQSADQFGQICLHFATIAGDMAMISRFSADAERRAMWLLKQSMGKAAMDWPYLKGIARRMGFGVDAWGPDAEAELAQMPAELILKLNAAVYLYSKRREKNDLAARKQAMNEVEQKRSA